MTSGYLQYLTSTVGLVTTKIDDRVNVMAAEWSYFVAREPLHIAVSIAEQNWSHRRIQEAGEFAITLCEESQAAIAAFAGSLTGLDVDKTTSADLELVGPMVLDTPHVRGGALNAECVIREIVELPGYALVIGEAMWVEVDDDAATHPLVKHGAMHTLGPVVLDDRTIVAANFPDPGEPVLRVAATAYGAPLDAPWLISVSNASTGASYLDLSSGEDGILLMVDVQLPPEACREPLVVRVCRGNCVPGVANVGANVIAAVS